MWVLETLGSLVLIFLVLIDGFEAILQPRRVMHRYRYARLYYTATWMVWRNVALCIAAGKRREAFLGIYGPLSLLGLFITWMTGLLVGFALLHQSLGTPVHAPQNLEGPATILTYLYLSGTTLLTLGYGDVTPTAPLGRGLAVVECGLGFGSLAIIVAYLPVLFQAFSHREVTISLLDARAGSPPSAAQVLLRLAREGRLDAVELFLVEWERWAAELLESHLSFPVLSYYYRSQHDNQSWLAALAAMLDTCALLIAEVKGRHSYQAQLTFAMARHAAVDLALVLKTPPRVPPEDRLPPAQLERLRQMLENAGLELSEQAAGAARLAELRGMYEPFLSALAEQFSLLPSSRSCRMRGWPITGREAPGCSGLPASAACRWRARTTSHFG